MDKNDILDYVTETPGNTNRAVLGSMLDSVGGTDLPAVTSDDNGNVLTVVEGVWDKAEANNNCRIIILEQESVGSSHYSDSPLSPEEIAELISNGVSVSIYLKNKTSYSPYYHMMQAIIHKLGADGDGGTNLEGLVLTPGQEAAKVYIQFIINYDKTVTIW